MKITKDTVMTWTNQEHRKALAMVFLAGIRKEANDRGIALEWSDDAIRRAGSAAPELIVDLINMLPDGWPKLRLDGQDA